MTIRFDPRVKILFLILCVAATALSPSIYYNIALVSFVCLFGIVSGRVWYSLFMTLLYIILLTMVYLAVFYLDGVLKTLITSFTDIMGKMHPAIMLSGIIVYTTKVNEFMAALTKLHVSKTIIIPLAVMLRYFPMVREDWRYIRDSMKMRDVAPNFKGLIAHPSSTMECVYVPLMTAASKAVDELTLAAITRGIESNKQRTCMTKLHLHVWDYVGILVFTLFVTTSFFI